ncbi:MAG: GGDEF domain-containing protein, partial [Polyangiales bacterium]
AVASAQQPRIAFLDVTIGDGAGIGLVHFLQSVVHGLVVVAIVPEGADQDVRLVEQAASLGASWVLLGELTGDDVLRAFGRVAPAALARSVPPLASPPPAPEPDDDEEAPMTRRAEALSETRNFRDLDVSLATLGASFGGGDPRAAIVHDVRAAIERCLAAEREGRATIQDTNTSAYSFAYFVDLAGREIDLARRHGRRFALATVDLAGSELDARAAIEIVLTAVRDTDVVARADQDELLLLLPETGAKGARTLRRRILDRAESKVARGTPMRMGLASFPFDGEDLSRLLRISRRRAARWAPLDSHPATAKALTDAVEWLGNPKRGTFEGPFVPIEVPLREGWSLFDTLVREATRAGDATIAIHAPQNADALGLAQGVRAAALDTIGGAAAPRGEGDHNVLSLMTGVSRLSDEANFQGLEVVALVAEHASYGLVGRVEEGRLLALHGHDLPLVEAMVNGLEQPVFRRGVVGASPSSSAPTSVRSSRSDPAGLRR